MLFAHLMISIHMIIAQPRPHSPGFTQLFNVHVRLTGLHVTTIYSALHSLTAQWHSVEYATTYTKYCSYIVYDRELQVVALTSLSRGVV